MKCSFIFLILRFMIICFLCYLCKISVIFVIWIKQLPSGWLGDFCTTKLILKVSTRHLFRHVLFNYWWWEVPSLILLAPLLRRGCIVILLIELNLLWFEEFCILSLKNFITMNISTLFKPRHGLLVLASHSQFTLVPHNFIFISSNVVWLFDRHSHGTALT